MEAFLDRLHARARATLAFQRLAVISRILLALAFIPTSLVKVLGQRFTVMPDTTPIGYFFEAMYQSGGYWRFIGWAQLLAGALLLVPRTSLLGAVMFLPIVLNIFVITVALGFDGTPFVTGPMVLANIFLLCWDYHRLKPLLWWPRAAGPVEWAQRPLTSLERVAYAIGTAAGLAFFGATRSLVPRALILPALVAGFVAGVIVLVAWLRGARSLDPNPLSD